jgi:putative endonuclease
MAVEAEDRALRAPDNQAIGKAGEDMACEYLRRGGARIVERNWRCKAGEADIIAMEDEVLVFVEVKTRRSVRRGLPEEAVDAQKRRGYERIAVQYLASHDVASCRVRFDIIAILLYPGERAFVRHHRDAFCFGE